MDETQRLSFGPVAAHYDSVRPTYPAEAVRWALGPGVGGTVVELGAGTGLLTRVIAGLDGTTVIPVEPDPLMRAQLDAGTPGITARDGSAESIPVGDGAADAVIAGQAYHWFDRDTAHPEIARVIRPGGVFAPIWNIRDESVPWIAEYTRIIGDTRGHLHDGWLVDADFGPWFGPVQREIFRHAVPIDRPGLVRLLQSRSYYLTATPQRQKQLVDEIGALAVTLPSTFDLPYLTVCYQSVRGQTLRS
ncbi:MAG TPA: class I SAM-dependent methyltransferase [Micromonosporaceae bacterium]